MRCKNAKIYMQKTYKKCKMITVKKSGGRKVQKKCTSLPQHKQWRRHWTKRGVPQPALAGSKKKQQHPKKNAPLSSSTIFGFRSYIFGRAVHRNPNNEHFPFFSFPSYRGRNKKKRKHRCPPSQLSVTLKGQCWLVSKFSAFDVPLS